MWLKMCPKCRGDLFLREEPDGIDIVCMQCGISRPVRPQYYDLLERVEQEPPEKRAAA